MKISLLHNNSKNYFPDVLVKFLSKFHSLPVKTSWDVMTVKFKGSVLA